MAAARSRRPPPSRGRRRRAPRPASAGSPRAPRPRRTPWRTGTRGSPRAARPNRDHPGPLLGVVAPARPRHGCSERPWCAVPSSQTLRATSATSPTTPAPRYGQPAPSMRPNRQAPRSVTGPPRVPHRRRLRGSDPARGTPGASAVPARESEQRGRQGGQAQRPPPLLSTWRAGRAARTSPDPARWSRVATRLAGNDREDAWEEAHRRSRRSRRRPLAPPPGFTGSSADGQAEQSEARGASAGAAAAATTPGRRSDGTTAFASACLPRGARTPRLRRSRRFPDPPAPRLRAEQQQVGVLDGRLEQLGTGGRVTDVVVVPGAHPPAGDGAGVALVVHPHPAGRDAAQLRGCR